MSHELRSRGWRVATVEWRSAHRPTVLADVVRWERDRSREYIRTRGAPDAVIAGPPCTTRSKRSWSRHREVGTGTGKPTSAAARHADEREVVAAWSFIQRCIQHNPSCVYALENPDTVAWAQVPVLQPHLEAGEFHSIQYGDYGWPLLKPTAIVTNLAAWEPEPRVAERSRVKWDDAPPNIKPRWPPLLAAALGDAMEAARR